MDIKIYGYIDIDIYIDIGTDGTDCYFCLTNTKGLKSMYRNVLCIRPMFHGT